MLPAAWHTDRFNDIPLRDILVGIDYLRASKVPACCCLCYFFVLEPIVCKELLIHDRQNLNLTILGVHALFSYIFTHTYTDFRSFIIVDCYWIGTRTFYKYYDIFYCYSNLNKFSKKMIRLSGPILRQWYSDVFLRLNVNSFYSSLPK